MDSEKLYSMIKSLGLNAQFEVRVGEESGRSISIEKGNLKGYDSVYSKTAIVRAICDGKSSSILAHVSDDGEIKELIEKAYRLSKNGSKRTQSCFAWKKHSSMKDPFSKKIYDVEPDDLLSRLSAAVKKVSSMKKVYSVNAGLSYLYSTNCAANSAGIKGDWKQSYSAVYSNVIAKDSSGQASSSKAEESLDPYGLRFDEVLDISAERAKSMLNPKHAPTFKGSVLISPETAISIIKALVYAMSGEQILRKTSFLSGKMGSKIASPLIELSENPQIKGSPFNRSFDDELMPTSKKYLIKDGRLKTYLHNIYSSEKMHQKPTGNGFGSAPSVGTTNVVLKPGRITEEELLSKIKRGVYLMDTGDSPNMSTGDLSAMVSEGFYVEDGEKKYPLKETMVGINMVDLMKNVVGIASKTVGLVGVYSPALLIEGAQISGR